MSTWKRNLGSADTWRVLTFGGRTIEPDSSLLAELYLDEGEATDPEPSRRLEESQDS